ncbi:hypothetical protein [Robertmurraya kyonggiensis]|nr:hypothetical protein [Robertmurraya kyonggiensis]
MKDINPIEYTGKVLDKRNTLTAPTGENYPKPPSKRVSIQEQSNPNKP